MLFGARRGVVGPRRVLFYADAIVCCDGVFMDFRIFFCGV